MTETNLTGKTFGLLTVVSPHGVRKSTWVCKCACGNEVVLVGSRLGTYKSCGCRKGRHSHHRSQDRIYHQWEGMISRCKYPSSRSYKNYGARGIGVCDRWVSSFGNFLADMGECPDGLTLERIDKNGNYTPENCRWATVLEQGRNKRNNIWLETPDGRMSIDDAAKKAGIPYTTMWSRAQKITTQTAASLGWHKDQVVLRREN